MLLWRVGVAGAIRVKREMGLGRVRVRIRFGQSWVWTVIINRVKKKRGGGRKS